MDKRRIVFLLYFLTISGLFLYTFTQIDLSLTFSRITFLRNLVKSFQYIGYFQRPLSTYIYLSFLVLLFGFYFYFLKAAFRKNISEITFWKIIIATTMLLVFSYNAVSYDIFNYIFDAKIFTHYHLNPYLHKALDFPGDPMLSFMRWTHRVYPYGPVWLLLTIPLSYIGHNLFLPTFFLFKSLIAASYIGSIYYISKIFDRVKIGNKMFVLVFFALNPIVIIESLVSGHLDMVMIFFALFSLYKLIDRKYLLAVVLLIISIGIKFSTIFLLPVFVWIVFLQLRKKKISWNIVFSLAGILMMSTVYFSSIYSGNFQPWYLLLPIAFLSFSAKRNYVLFPAIIFTFLALLIYAPYLYLGNWDKPVPQILSTIIVSSCVLSAITFLYFAFKNKLFASKHEF